MVKNESLRLKSQSIFLSFSRKKRFIPAIKMAGFSLKDNKCFGCGLCCCIFLINLSEEEYKSGKFITQFEEFGMIDDFYKAADCGANILKQKADGSCIYLNANRCSIHQIRPQACKEFFCSSRSSKFQKMIGEIKSKRAS